MSTKSCMLQGHFENFNLLRRNHGRHLKTATIGGLIFKYKPKAVLKFKSTVLFFSIRINKNKSIYKFKYLRNSQFIESLHITWIWLASKHYSKFKVYFLTLKISYIHFKYYLRRGNKEK